jgi:hypothetical protein
MDDMVLVITAMEGASQLAPVGCTDCSIDQTLMQADSDKPETGTNNLGQRDRTGISTGSNMMG